MDADQALTDLTEISSQIEAAVLLDGSGNVVASTLADQARSNQIAKAAQELVGAAEQVRAGSGGQPLTQLEAATREGSFFIVRDGERLIAATTSPEPTVGLVFYDLKSCLRSAAASAAEQTEPEKPKRTRRKKADSPKADASS